MNRDAVFSDFKVKEKSDEFVVRGSLDFKLWEKAGIFIIFLLIVLPIVSYFRIINGYVLGAICLIVAFIAYKKIRLGVTIFTINKKTNLLTANVDKFETPKDELRGIQIIERVTENQNKLYGLKYSMPDGEIESTFSFKSYNKIKDLVDVLKRKS